MTSPCLHRCWLVLLVFTAMALSPGLASAARPIKGAYYAGIDGTVHDLDFPYPSSSPRQGSFQAVAAELRVSRSGRRLTGRGRGAYVRARFDCKADEYTDEEGFSVATMRLSSRRIRGPRIRRTAASGP